MSDDIATLPQELRALIDAEQRGPGGEPDRDRIRTRVHATLGLATSVSIGAVASTGSAAAAMTSGATAAAGIAGTATKVTALVVALAAAGTGGTYLALRDEPPARVQTREHREPAMPAPDPLVTAREASEEEVATPIAMDVLPPSPSVAAPLAQTAPTRRLASAKVAAPPSELSLLSEATRAVAAGKATLALASLDDHARLYGTSVLAEERDALRIEALMLAKRDSEARDLARRFLAAYPSSLHTSLATRVAADVSP